MGIVCFERSTNLYRDPERRTLAAEGQMTTVDTGLLAALIFVAAVIYSALGQAGATGYLAAMALFGMPTAAMRSTALTLNILVASIGTFRWRQAGLVHWKAVLPLLLTSVPASFLGGTMELSGKWYRLLVSAVLILGALQMLSPKSAIDYEEPPRVPWLTGMLAGTGIGFLSGLTGTGGGIFLSPLLLALGWAGTRQSFGMSAPFNLINSIAALAGNILLLQSLPPELPYLFVAALLGGIVGTQIGLRLASAVALQRLLAAVLLVAAVKFIAAA
jgi:uncharacterized membrane protein YfcA